MSKLMWCLSRLVTPLLMGSFEEYIPGEFWFSPAVSILFLTGSSLESPGCSVGTAECRSAPLCQFHDVCLSISGELN